MGDFVFDLQRIPDVKRSTENVSKEITESRSLITRAALVVERQAKKNASGRPGPKVKTGRLRSSITSNITSATQAKVGTNVVYAPFVEYGHSQHPGQFVPPLGKRLVKSRAPAYPFMSPVLEQTKAQIDGVVVEFGKDLGSTWEK